MKKKGRRLLAYIMTFAMIMSTFAGSSITAKADTSGGAGGYRTTTSR